MYPFAESSDIFPCPVAVFVIELEFTSHPPIKAEAVVNLPKVASIVVIPETDAELKVSPLEFNIYPAPDKEPPVFALSVTVLPVSVPLNIDAPLAIFTFPLKDPFLA